MKVEFSGQVFEKSSNIKFHENLLCESRVVPCGQTGRQTYKWKDRHGEANGRFVVVVVVVVAILQTPNNSSIAK
jgi:hypothetical protein